MPPRDPDLRREQSNHPREFSDFVYAYPVLSRRSGGVSIGVNLNIDKHCNFDCPYCQVDRTAEKPRQAIDVTAVREELEALLSKVDAAGVMRIEKFAAIADADKRLKDIAVSGDGEPTMVPEFKEICGMLAALQEARQAAPGRAEGAPGGVPDPFKLILITNSTLLDRRDVIAGIDSLLSRKGEVWAKLDAGTEAWYQKINISRVSLDRVEANLIRLGQSHPFAIQSMFCGIAGEIPDRAEIDAYLDRLRRIQASGARILEVQLYTLARKPAQDYCTPVTPEFLSNLRARILAESGIAARVYGVA
jgi:wyosine [tRNA(Phe)-imidazoG37] synthetase (radical SAM superfamily)